MKKHNYKVGDILVKANADTKCYGYVNGDSGDIDSDVFVAWLEDWSEYSEYLCPNGMVSVACNLIDNIDECINILNNQQLIYLLSECCDINNPLGLEIFDRFGYRTTGYWSIIGAIQNKLISLTQ